MEKVKIDRIAMLQLFYIRNVGETNMFEINNVIAIANRHNFKELLNWLNINRDNYNKAILYGVEEDIAIDDNIEIKEEPLTIPELEDIYLDFKRKVFDKDKPNLKVTYKDGIDIDFNKKYTLKEFFKLVE